MAPNSLRAAPARRIILTFAACALALSALAATACGDECGDLTRVCDSEGENCRCAPSCAKSDDCGEHEFCLPSRGLCVPLTVFVDDCDGRPCNGSCRASASGCSPFCVTDADCPSSERCGTFAQLTPSGKRKSVKLCRPRGGGGCKGFVDDPTQTTHRGESLGLQGAMGLGAADGKGDPYQPWFDCACHECPACNRPTGGPDGDGGVASRCMPYAYAPVSRDCESCVSECESLTSSSRLTCCEGESSGEASPRCAACASKSPKNFYCTADTDACTSCLERIKNGACASAWTLCSEDR